MRKVKHWQPITQNTDYYQIGYLKKPEHRRDGWRHKHETDIILNRMVLNTINVGSVKSKNKKNITHFGNEYTTNGNKKLNLRIRYRY